MPPLYRTERATVDLPVDISIVQLAIDLGNLSSLQAVVNSMHDTEFVELLEERDENGFNILLRAVDCGHLSIVRYLVDERGADINVEYFDGELTLNDEDTPMLPSYAIHLAAQNDHLNIVKYLVKEKCVDVNLPGDDKQTPLHFAVEFGHLDVVTFLVNHGADIMIPSSKICHEQLVFHIACYYGYVDVVQFLYKRMPSIVSVAGERHLYPVHLAANSNNVEVLQFLIEVAGESIERLSGGNEQAITPLLAAVLGDANEAVLYLINKGARTQVRFAPFDKTPLHVAVELDNIDIVEALVRSNRKLIDIPDIKGETPLDLVRATSGHEDVLKVIEDTAFAFQHPIFVSSGANE